DLEAMTPPAKLTATGEATWAALWRLGASWIAPGTEEPLVLAAAQQAEMLEVARRRHERTGSHATRGAVVALRTSYRRSLRFLGFTDDEFEALGAGDDPPPVDTP
ncbi:MAG: hypothetical protein ACKOZL_03185, partial [Actinomycetes bacterium]